jgi:hypothetical protein
VSTLLSTYHGERVSALAGTYSSLYIPEINIAASRYPGHVSDIIINVNKAE